MMSRDKGCIVETSTPAPTRSRSGRRRNRRVSDEHSRVDSAMLLWYNSLHSSLFVSTPTGESSAIVPFRLASGVDIKVGDILSKSAVDSHISQMQDDTPHQVGKTPFVPSWARQRGRYGLGLRMESVLNYQTVTGATPMTITLYLLRNLSSL